jgi:four helix bundle protein
MATVRKFEDLEIWKMSAKLDVEIFKLIDGNIKLSRDFRLRYQMLGSSGSIMDNIAEGFERGGNREFIQFLSISKGSAGELRSQIRRCYNREHISEEVQLVFVRKCENVSERLSNFMTYLRRSEYKGPKFRTEIKSLNLESLNVEH